MMYKLVIATILAVLAWDSLAAPTVQSHLSSNDLNRLQKVFSDALDSSDLQSVYYASLNVQPAKSNADICKRVRALHEESKLNAFEKDFYLIGAHKSLRCADKLPEMLLTKTYAALKQDFTSAAEIYYRVATHKVLGVQIDAATTSKLVKALEDLLRKDDSLAGLGYAFNVATELAPAASFVTTRVEDAFVQADEVDGKILQFEGGLSITALLVNGAFNVNKAFKKQLPLNEDQAKKFANYFLSRRSVQTAKGAHLLIEALKTLSGAGKISPICVQFVGNGQLQVESPQLAIMVVDLLGKPLTPAPQTISCKVQNNADKTLLADKIPLVSKSSDKSVFVADLSAYKPSRGIYTVDITMAGGYQQKLEVKVLGRVEVKSLELGIAESDSASGYQKHSLAYPKTLTETLTADNTQKLILKTVLLDKDTQKAIGVHQAFVQLYNKETNKEVVFIAEQDANKAYKFDLEIGAHAAEFSHKSGHYEMYLIIGDALLSNSFKWHVANINFKFSSDHQDTNKVKTGVPLPEIHHQFRVPEKRPARIVSDIFTGLCLTPLVLFIVSWGKLGVNVSNFSFAPSTIGFHLGLGGILTLFGVFWWKLNMFDTLRLLIPIAVFTFLCGNRLLRQVYAKRMAKATS